MYPALLEIAQTCFDFLANIDAVHQIVPRRSCRKRSHELKGLAFDAAAFAGSGWHVRRFGRSSLIGKPARRVGAKTGQAKGNHVGRKNRRRESVSRIGSGPSRRRGRIGRSLALGLGNRVKPNVPPAGFFLHERTRRSVLTAVGWHGSKVRKRLLIEAGSPRPVRFVHNRCFTHRRHAPSFSPISRVHARWESCQQHRVDVAHENFS